MIKDRTIKGLLAICALLLACNFIATLYPGKSSVNVLSNAEAQNSRNAPRRPVYNVKDIKGFTVNDLKEIVPLGDGKTFVVSNPNGFMVYQVEQQVTNN